MIQITTTWAHISSLLAALLAIIGAFAYHFDRRLAALDKHLDSIERRLERLESAFIHK
jgi:hypothetical protein